MNMAASAAQPSPSFTAQAPAPSQADVISTTNRNDYSHAEMEKLDRKDGDLFAVFTDEAGGTRVQYARFEDYARFAQRQVARRTSAPADRQTYLYLVGAFMVSRIHNYDLYGFVHLLDHNLRELFNLRDLVDWIALNPELFAQPMTEVIYAEEDYDRLEAEFMRQEQQQ